MRRYLILILIVAFSGSGLEAQEKSRKKLAELVSKFNVAIIQTDSTTLKNLVWDELSYGHSSGIIQNKAAFIAGVMNGTNFFKKIELQNQTVEVFGETAIIRHLATAQAVNKGTPVEIKFGNILIWQKRKGEWKILARQGYKI